MQQPAAPAPAEQVAPRTKSKELTNKERQSAVSMLLGRRQQGRLARGSITIVAKKFGVHRHTISRLWARAESSRAHDLLIPPEINSRKNARGRKPKYYLDDRKEAVKQPPFHSWHGQRHTIMSSSSSTVVAEEVWHKKEDELTEQSHIDESIKSRAESLEKALTTFLPPDDSSSALLQKALFALAEATAHIAVHLQNYVQHTYAGSQNASGDEQLHLDILCDEEVFKAVRASGVFATVASEETPQETKVGEGELSLGCDPLDGSSIIDANFAVGSIYGIWPGKSLVGIKGRDQVASAVALYGPRTLLAIALPAHKRVIEVTLVENRTRWEISRDKITIEPAGKIFAPGNLRATNDHGKYAKMIEYWMKNRYQLRYSGGMVPDVYHILAKGKGIFSNASSEKAKAKLRLLYEVAPLGLVVECAGGVAMDEGKDISVLDITIEHTDQRLGVCFGSRDEVEKYKEIMFN